MRVDVTGMISKARESWENKVAAVMPPLSFIHHKTHKSHLYLLTTAHKHAPRNPKFKVQIHLDTITTPYTAHHRLPVTRQKSPSECDPVQKVAHESIGTENGTRILD